MIRSPIPRKKPEPLVCWRCGFHSMIWSPTVTGVLKCPNMGADARKCPGLLHSLYEQPHVS